VAAIAGGGSRACLGGAACRLSTTAAYASSCIELASALSERRMAAMSLDFDASPLLITLVLMGK